MTSESPKANQDAILGDARRARLTRRLKDVRKSSPFYHELYSHLPTSQCFSVEDLSKIPTVTKSEIIASQLAHPPYGRLVAGSPKLFRTTCSPGPEYLAWSFSDWNISAETIGKAFSNLCGVEQQDVVDITLTYHWVPAGTLFDDIFASLGCHVIPGGPGMSELHLQVIGDLRATVIFGFTPFVEHLGEQATELGIDSNELAVRLLIIGGELRDESAKERLSVLWGGAQVVEFYGVAEMGIVGLECTESAGMHVLDHVIVEVVDPDTGVHQDPLDGGELVVTDLLKEAMPIVRYRTGDITEWVDPAPCPCGSTAPRIGRILGRRSSIHRVRGLFMNPQQVIDALTRVEGLGNCHIIIDRTETTDSLVIEVESAASSPEFIEVVKSRLQQAIRLRPQVRFVPPGSIDQDNGFVTDNRQDQV